MKKDIERLRNKLEASREFDMNKSIKWKNSTLGEHHAARAKATKEALGFLGQLDEPEVLSQDWIDEHVGYAYIRGGTRAFILVKDLQNLLMSKQEDVDQEQVQKYFSEHGIEVVEKEPETVADVIAVFYKSLEKLKEALSTEVKK